MARRGHSRPERGTGGTAIRVLLVDDEPLLRMAFTMVLEARCQSGPRRTLLVDRLGFDFGGAVRAIA
jgi:hypothetical protein